MQIKTGKGAGKSLSYDRLVVATGSRLFRPNIPGLAEHGFSVDSLDDAIALDRHLHGLAKRPAVNGRDTVVVAGGGFTGIEAATEMPARLREKGDPSAAIDEHPGRLDGLLELAARDEREGLGDAPWPPHFRKQKGEPKRVQPSRAKGAKAKAEGNK